MSADDLERRLAQLLDPDDPDRVLGDDEVMGLFAFGLAEARFAAGAYEDAARWARLSLARRPPSMPAHALLAASCGLLGRPSEARCAMDQLLKQWPEFRLSHIKLLFCDRSVDFLERLRDGLRRAGLP